MRSDDWQKGFRQGTLFGSVVFSVVFWSVFLLTSCTAALVPSGKPSCPNRTLWSDSAQRCIAREGR